MMQTSKIDFNKIEISDVEYWCPEEFIEVYEAKILKDIDIPYKPKNPTGLCCAHWFYFCVLKNGNYDMVSGIEMESFLRKEIYEFRIKGVNDRPKMSDMAAKAIAQFIMKDELNNMDDLLDDNISRSLRQLGFTFPQTVEDFICIEECVKTNNISLPARLQDPYSFLGRRAYIPTRKNVHEQSEYFQQLAQPARDGKIISEDIKKKMAEDKLKSGKMKNDK